MLDGLERRTRRGPKISTTAIAWAAIVFCVFIAGGGIYDLLDDPITLFPGAGGGWLAIHPYTGEQTLNESLVSMILTFFTFAGLLVSYRSTKVAYDRRKANMMLLLGIALVLMGLAGSHFLLILKRTAGR